MMGESGYHDRFRQFQEGWIEVDMEGDRPFHQAGQFVVERG